MVAAYPAEDALFTRVGFVLMGFNTTIYATKLWHIVAENVAHATIVAYPKKTLKASGHICATIWDFLGFLINALGIQGKLWFYTIATWEVCIQKTGALPYYPQERNY